jgi:hypothetical protein
VTELFPRKAVRPTENAGLVPCVGTANAYRRKVIWKNHPNTNVNNLQNACIHPNTHVNNQWNVSIHPSKNVNNRRNNACGPIRGRTKDSDGSRERGIIHFYLLMRLYLPKKEALDGEWKPVPVVRVDN